MIFFFLSLIKNGWNIDYMYVISPIYDFNSLYILVWFGHMQHKSIICHLLSRGRLYPKKFVYITMFHLRETEV